MLVARTADFGVLCVIDKKGPLVKPKVMMKYIRYNEEQYKKLVDCAKTGKIDSWNRWREQNENAEIILDDADLTDLDLRGVNLRSASLISTRLSNSTLMGADLSYANLHDAELWGTNLSGTAILGAQLESALFEASIVDGETLIWGCTFDKDTDFTGVGLGSARVEPGLREHLEGNIRRKRWLAWSEERPLLRFPVILFWIMSDYGNSTIRVILFFFIWALAFAIFYYTMGVFDLRAGHTQNPGIIDNLFVINNSPLSPELIPARAIYFSVVTMTTLGFGDMYAKPESQIGHVALTFQVILGYVLLGALVTRLAVLFTSGGPGETYWGRRVLGVRVEIVEDDIEQS